MVRPCAPRKSSSEPDHIHMTSRVKIHEVLLVVAGVALVTSALGQGASSGANQGQEAHPYVLCPSGKVIGLDLHNETEKNLGDIGDLLIDPHSGEIRYAALEVRGILGIGEEFRVVPWSFI